MHRKLESEKIDTIIHIFQELTFIYNFIYKAQNYKGRETHLFHFFFLMMGFGGFDVNLLKLVTNLRGNKFRVRDLGLFSCFTT